MPDDDGILTDRDIERINEWMESRGIEFRCPLCRKDEYAFGDQLVDLPAYQRQAPIAESFGEPVSGDVYTYVQLCCTSCGATQLISAEISGILKPDPVVEEAKREAHQRVLDGVAEMGRKMKEAGQ